MSDSIFQSNETFKQQFIGQLVNLLDSDELGVFILVLANASINTEIYDQLANGLEKQFYLLKQKLKQTPDIELRQLPEDDLSVFHQLIETGFEKLQLSQQKEVSGWQIQFNQLRSFRPARNSQKIITQLYQPFNASSFHFNKPFLQKERLWEGVLGGSPVRILYNKFPFADYHAIVVIEPAKEKAQFLQSSDCINMQNLLHELQPLQGLGLAYNSLGAYASVNHQHWQLFISGQDYPVEMGHWRHNDGSIDYPIPVLCFSGLQQAWPSIEKFQNSNTAFNILARPDKTYLVSRKIQSGYQHSHWTSGFAWSEIMGNITATRLRDFELINLQDIETEFQRLAI